MATNRIKAVELYEIDSATFTAGYDLVTDPGFTHQICILRVVNDSNRDIYISYDGVHDHDYLIASKTLQLSFQDNVHPNNWILTLAKGTKIYVKAAAGTGKIYIAGYYQE